MDSPEQNSPGRNRHAETWMPSKLEATFYAFVGVVLILGCAYVFSNWPNLDKDVSHSFTNDGAGFPAQTDDFVTTFRKAFLFAIFFFYVLVIGGWIDAFNNQKKVLGRYWHHFSFIGFSALIGPVLIVNVLLKGNWGRARPQFIEEFGGSLQYTDFWIWSDQCRDNCSFTSGEVAGVAMVFLSLAFVMKPFWRVVVLFVGAVCTAIITWKRLAMGAHFLSDTLMSVALMLITVSIVYWFFYLRRADWITWFDRKQQEKLDSEN